MDFKTEQDLDQESGLPSGFLNLHVVGKTKKKVNLLIPILKKLPMIGQEIALHQIILLAKVLNPCQSRWQWKPW